MATNSEVVSAWSRGTPAKAGNLSTDGDRIWSYDLEIGKTNKHGHKIGLAYVAPYAFKTHTTSCHVGLVCNAADRFLHPETHEQLWPVIDPTPLQKAGKIVEEVLINNGSPEFHAAAMKLVTS